MNVQTALFYLFSAVLLFAALRVITARNTVHAVLYLVLAFSQASMLWMLLRAEFLAIALILVYVGAVMVLFLFVVMMLDIKFEREAKGFWARFAWATAVGGLIALEIAAVGASVRIDPNAMATLPGGSNTAALGALLYGPQYVYAVEIAAVILLVAIVAAIALTMRGRKDSKYIAPAAQVRVKAHERMKLVHMPVTQLAPAPEKAPPVEDQANPPPVAGASTPGGKTA